MGKATDGVVEIKNKREEKLEQREKKKLYSGNNVISILLSLSLSLSLVPPALPRSHCQRHPAEGRAEEKTLPAVQSENDLCICSSGHSSIIREKDSDNRLKPFSPC